MFEQDYLMKIIKNLVSLLAKAFFGKDDITYEISDDKEYKEADDLHKKLIVLIDIEEINEAENLLFKKLKTDDRRYMELSIDFYKRLNDTDDKFLERNNFSRIEIKDGLKEVARKFGMFL